MELRIQTVSALTVAALGLLLPAPSAHAQTAPTPATTFTAGGDQLWSTDGNWSLGDTPTASDDARINDGQTVVHDIDVLIDAAEMVFGTLTLGTNSTFRFDPGNGKNFPAGKDIYLSDGSHVEYTGGSVNRGCDFFILPGASATMTTVGRQSGTIQGAGDLTVIMKSDLELRATCNGHSGNLTFLSNNGTARRLNPSYGGNLAILGTVTLGDQVYTTGSGGLADSTSLKLVGAGPSSQKYTVGSAGGTGPSEIVSNLIIESPSVSAPFLLTGNSGNSGQLKVNDTVTFQGTAGTIEIKNLNEGWYSGAKRADCDNLQSSNLVFKGTGTWTIVGTRADPTNTIYDLGAVGVVAGGTITTDVDAIFSNALNAASGFTKAGLGALTIGDPSGIASEITLNEGGIVFTTNASFTASDYVFFGSIPTAFTADFGGSFADIAAVNAAMGDTGSFRRDAGLTGDFIAKDNANGTFTVLMGPSGGLVILIK